MDLTPTYYIAVALAACLLVWPEETVILLVALSLKLQLIYLNFRMKWMAWQLHRSLVRMAKAQGLPSPGPFTYVNLWDRENKS